MCPILLNSDFNFIADCPTECECLEFGMCHWSVKILKKIEESKNDSVLYWSYYNQFRKYICDWKEQKVCCCGQEQTDPDQWGLSNEISMTNIVNRGILSSEQESKFLSSLFLIYFAPSDYMIQSKYLQPVYSH